jgi:hypothetical protein
MDQWTEDIESGGQVDVIYTDLEKAFDKVPHNRLISKLKSYGTDFEIVKWVEVFYLAEGNELKLEIFFHTGLKFKVVYHKVLYSVFYL